jgi:predicted XRE-type DNA-binding protein
MGRVRHGDGFLEERRRAQTKVLAPGRCDDLNPERRLAAGEDRNGHHRQADAREPRSGAKAPEGDDAMNKKTSADRLAKLLGIPKSRGLEAVLKAQLIAAVLREVDRRGLTHAELATHSGLSRSAVTGILSGSLQKVTIDRVLRLVEAAGLEADIRVRRAA